MKKTLLQLALTTGLLLSSGEALAVKDFKDIKSSGGQASTDTTIKREDVLEAVNAVCQAWNTLEMTSNLDPAFPEKEALLNTIPGLPKDARLIFVELEGYQTTQQEVIASVKVRVELGYVRYEPFSVVWTFKLFD